MPSSSASMEPEPSRSRSKNILRAISSSLSEILRGGLYSATFHLGSPCTLYDERLGIVDPRRDFVVARLHAPPPAGGTPHLPWGRVGLGMTRGSGR